MTPEEVDRIIDAEFALLPPCPACDGRGELVPPACSWDEDDRTCYRCAGNGKDMRKPLPLP